MNLHQKSFFLCFRWEINAWWWLLFRFFLFYIRCACKLMFYFIESTFSVYKMSEKKMPVRVVSWPEVTSSNCLSSTTHRVVLCLSHRPFLRACFLVFLLFFFNSSSGWFDQHDRLVMLCEASKCCCHGYPQFNAPCKTLVPWYEFVFFCGCSLTDRFLSGFFFNTSQWI